MKIFVVYAILFLAVALAAPAEKEVKSAEMEVKPADKEVKPADEVVKPADTNVKAEKNEKYEKQRAENAAVCRKESGVTEEQIEFLLKEPKSEQPQVAKCYINCIVGRTKEAKDGEFKKETFDIYYSKDGITKEQAEKFAKECSAQKADDPCEQGYQFFVCFNEKSSKLKNPSE
ncbi:Odorant binding protein 13 [Cephus cinctus]|uniref:Uncharacterized protein LOC107265455 n=1 Tax=Cephus cinctus TaxID=211228 RepID=A0A3L9M0R8_CEPCN|nr:uncharacterized protein LOC107265455 [Cephus cinctus]RLZ02173.1 Odorant binding protein 13 [Cephus cinctus]